MMYYKREQFEIGDRVTDGDCEGIVTNVFTSCDAIGTPTPCLAVKLPNGQESFSCTRQDWWRHTP